MDEKDRDGKWKRIDDLIRQFRELNRRANADRQAIIDIQQSLHELSDSETLDEINRKLKSLSDHDKPTTTDRKEPPPS